MKATLILLAVLFCASLGSAQTDNAYADSVTVGTSVWTKYDPKNTFSDNNKVYRLTIINDTDAVLWVAFEDDTADGRYYQINGLETWWRGDLRIDYFRMKARSSCAVRYEVE